MKLLVISHKECWRDPSGSPGYVTVGGFPFQMQALSALFDQTTLLITLKGSSPPTGALSLVGSNLIVDPIPEPAGSDLIRKLHLPFWFLKNQAGIISHIRKADAVHALVPGDIGFMGLMIALIKKKRLFVRHCGTWASPLTFWDRLLFRVIEHFAGKRMVAFATGWGSVPPSARNSAVRWIFSTTLTRNEIDLIQPAAPREVGEPLELVTVGRLSVGKNIQASIEAVQGLRNTGYDLHLNIIGDGPDRKHLQQVVQSAGLAEHITFLGNLPHQQVMKVLCSSHLFVFPTLVKEGFPKAVLEAMACGLPVIATAVSVIPHLVGDQCGLLLYKSDSEELSNVIVELLLDPGRMNAMGRRSRVVAMEFTLEKWQEIIKETLEASWNTVLKHE